MKVYAYEHTIGKDGVLSLKNLPFNVGEKIEVIIIPRHVLTHSEYDRGTWRK